MADLKIENARLRMENGQLKKELETRVQKMQVMGTETEMVMEEEDEEEQPERKVVTLATIDKWTQSSELPSSSSGRKAATQPSVKPGAKPRPTIDTSVRVPALPPSPATGLELVAQRIRRKQETSKSLPADLSVFANVANTQTQLNLQVVKLENELLVSKQQVERLTNLLNQQQRK
jgi:hypothetical protein